MTQGAVKQLRRLQLAKESAHGTGVASTARLIGDFNMTDETEMVRPERDMGLLTPFVEAPVEAQKLALIPITTDLSYEQILYPLYAGVKGGVTGVEQNPGEGDYKYTFTPPVAASPAVDSFTMEYVERDGAADIEAFRSVYCICRSLGIRATMGASLSEMVAEFVGRGITVVTPTADPGLPTRTLIPGQLWTVKFATTFDGLGAASVLETVVSFDWNLDTGIREAFRLAGSTDFTDDKFGARLATLSLVLDLVAATETERASYFRTGATRYIRLECQGAQIGAGDNYTITIDGAYKCVDGPSPGDDDGQSTRELRYESVYDATAGKDIEISVTNALTALP